MMGRQVKLGPVPVAKKGLSPMMKEICSRKSHLDLMFKCDDGSFPVHKMLVAGQSQFLKKMLLESMDEMTEIILPGVKQEHLKLVIRIIYTGTLKISKHDLQTTHTVWYVKQILTDILKFDININLGAYVLNRPPEADDDPPGGGPSPSDSSQPPPPSSSGNSEGYGTGAGMDGHESVNGDTSLSAKWFAGTNPRNNSGLPVVYDKAECVSVVAATPMEVGQALGVDNLAEKAVDTEMDTSACIVQPQMEYQKNSSILVHSGEALSSLYSNRQTSATNEDARLPPRSRNPTGTDSDIEELERPRLPTPELIHLLDSDPEDYAALGGEYQEEADDSEMTSGHSDDDDQGGVVYDEPNEEEEVVGRGGGGDQWQHVNDRVRIPEAPRLLPKKSQLADDDSDELAVGENRGPSQPSLKRRRRKKRRDLNSYKVVKTERLDETESNGLPTPRDQKKRGPGRPPKKALQTPVADSGPAPAPSLTEPFQAVFSDQPVLPHSDFLGPNQVVYRGKIVDARKRRKKTPKPKGPLPYNHIATTITGLKKASTLAVIKEEKALHPCDQCDRVYVKFRSLDIHKRRIHNTRQAAACPECGKRLSHQHALKKHMLSHMPEEMWPYECPICHKKFQARGDIPKHLVTKLHANDKIPPMGSKEWLELIYYDEPVDFEKMRRQLEKRQEKERSKLPDPAALEEFDSWNGTADFAPPDQLSSVNGGGAAAGHAGYAIFTPDDHQEAGFEEDGKEEGHYDEAAWVAGDLDRGELEKLPAQA